MKIGVGKLLLPNNCEGVVLYIRCCRRWRGRLRFRCGCHAKESGGENP